jgi:hypothetical protein
MPKQGQTQEKQESHPKTIQHKNAPTTIIESPQASNWLNNNRLASPAGIEAMHSAPMVDSGETSTKCPAMFIVSASPNPEANPSFATSPGTNGKNAGSTTPEVLE